MTGGSGFIGGALIRRLVAGGSTARALARSDRSAAALAELGAEPVRGDLQDVAAMTAGAEGCKAAFHLAAKVEQWGSREDFERDNVRGTANALEACAAAGVERLVHCGTEAAVLAGQPLVNADETAPLRPDSPALYSATKAEAERLVREASREGFETVVVRPRFVWGAGDTTLLPEIAAAAESGRWAWVNGGTHRTSITHVENVVEGLLLAAERGHPGEAYFVTDGDPVVFREFISQMLEARGVEPPTRTVPGFVAGAAGARRRARVAPPAPAWGAAADALRPLAGEPGMHARRLKGAARAGVRAGDDARAGPRRARVRLTGAPWPSLPLRWRSNGNGCRTIDRGRGRGAAACRPPRPGAPAPAGARRRPPPLRRTRLPGHLDGGDRGRRRGHEAGRLPLLPEQAGALPRPARARGAAPPRVRQQALPTELDPTDLEAVFTAGFTALFVAARSEPDSWRIVFVSEHGSEPAIARRVRRARTSVIERLAEMAEPMLASMGVEDAGRKAPVLSEVVASIAEGGVRLLLSDGKDWSPEELGSFLGRLVARGPAAV